MGSTYSWEIWAILSLPCPNTPTLAGPLPAGTERYLPVQRAARSTGESPAAETPSGCGVAALVQLHPGVLVRSAPADAPCKRCDRGFALRGDAARQPGPATRPRRRAVQTPPLRASVVSCRQEFPALWIHPRRPATSPG